MKLDPYNCFTFLTTHSQRSKALRVAVKDNIAVKGWPLTCASRYLQEYRSPYHATCIQHILQEPPDRYQLLGKCNLDEFAMGHSNTNSAFGPVLHPTQPHILSPGGSSGGSAVAVRAGLADLALGSDTGGSVRWPAILGGLVGFKGSFGAISRYGLVAYAPTLDTIGIIGRQVGQVRDLFLVCSQACQMDPKYQKLPPQPDLPITLEEVKFGRLLGKAQEAEEKKNKFYGQEAFTLPHFSNVLPVYVITAYAEAASSLARYTDNPPFLHPLPTSRSQLGSQVKKRIILGTAIQSQYPAAYPHAQRIRLIMKEALHHIFQKCHVLCTSIAGGERLLRAEVNDNDNYQQEDNYEAAIMRLANLTGIPSISIPTKGEEESLLLMAPWGQDLFLLSVAQLIMEDSN